MQFDKILDKNGIINVFANLLCTSFSLLPKSDYCENPFILSSTDRNPKPLIQDNTSIELLNKKKKLYHESPKVVVKKFFMIDDIKRFEFLEIEPEPNEEPIPQNLINLAILYLAQNQVVGDQQITILRELTKLFYIFPSGTIQFKPEDQLKQIDPNTPEHEKIRLLFQLPFDQYFKAIINYPKELVDEVVMAEEHKYFQNDRLPIKVLPLLVRETFVTKDGEAYQLSYRQMYKAFNSLKKRFVRNACPRQSGKTYDAVRDCYQRLLSKDYYRIIYICENETAFEQPRQYFKDTLKMAKDYGIIEMSDSAFTITCPFGGPTGNTLTFVSSMSKLGPRSFNGNYFVFDEGGKIKTSTRLDARPIINNAGAGVLVNSTIFWEMKKLDSEWFYDNLIAIELGFKQDEDTGEDERMALRVNVDQIERLDDKKKRDAKNQLRPYPDRYYCELYSQLPKVDSSVFPAGFFVIMDETKIQTDDFVILGRDLAKRVDTAGMVLLSQKDGIIFSEQRLRGYTYTQQIQIVKELKGLYPNLKVAADISNEESFIENNPTLIDYPIKFTSATAGYKKETRNGITVWNVGKEVLVNTFVDMAEQSKIKAISKLEMLRMEAENYMGKRNGRGGLSYQAQRGTDDLVSAVLCAAFIYKTTYLDPLTMWEHQKEARKRAIENLDRDDDGFVIRKKTTGYYNGLY